MDGQERLVYLVLLGAPGAGKGTQAQALAKEIGIQHVSSGDLFREAINAGTELGQHVKGYLDRGELVPDQVTVAMVMQRLGRPDCGRGAVLDGFPRTIAQAQALEADLNKWGRKIDLAPYIKVSESVLLGRLAGRWTCEKCGAIYHQLFNQPQRQGICDACGGRLFQRTDDTPETQRRRIRVYFEQTEPLIAYYRQRGLLVEIDGEKSVDEVRLALINAVRKI